MRLEQKKVQGCGVLDGAREVRGDPIMQSLVGHNRVLGFYYKSMVYFQGLRRGMIPGFAFVVLRLLCGGQIIEGGKSRNWKAIQETAAGVEGGWTNAVLDSVMVVERERILWI